MFQLRVLLSAPLSKLDIQQVASRALNNDAYFKYLFELVFSAEQPCAWRAAWACEKLSINNPTLFCTRQIERLYALSSTCDHDGTCRILLSILLHLPLPTSLSVQLINRCFDWISLPKTPTGIQSNAIKILYRVALHYPEFRDELQRVLIALDDSFYSVGFLAIKRKVLTLLRQLDSKPFFKSHSY